MLFSSIQPLSLREEVEFFEIILHKPVIFYPAQSQLALHWPDARERTRHPGRANESHRLCHPARTGPAAVYGSGRTAQSGSSTVIIWEFTLLWQRDAIGRAIPAVHHYR